MFTFMGMCGELLLYQRILLPGKAYRLTLPTGHGKSTIFQCLPDLCRELFLRRFPYPSNAIVVVVKFPS